MNILFICFASKLDALGKIPIYCRITIAGKRVELSTGISINIKNWNQKKQTATKNAPNCESVNIMLSELRNKITRIWLENEEITANQMKLNLQITKSEKTSLLLVIAQFLDNKRIMISKDKQIGGITQASYDVSFRIFNNLINYLEESKKAQILPEDVNEQFMNNYHSWLVDKKWTNDYIIKCLQSVKTSLNYAVQLGEILINPVNFHQLPKRSEVEVVYLTKEEKKQLENYSFASLKLTQVQDLFLFQCYTGFAYVDIYHFGEDHIDVSREFIKMKRTKTNNETIIPFLPKAQEIWEKYNKTLPKISNQNYNVYLKEIAGVLGINERLTTHVARKTFAMLILNAGASMEVVSRCLGHSNMTTTQQVYAKIKEDRILREFENIEL